ncbi:MAG: hypothetical protein M1402_02335 [Candidatus Thermoplasmatota archaeon]|nr:hypothetical protein [Candidatus Thermoplasmatota archaeon]
MPSHLFSAIPLLDKQQDQDSTLAFLYLKGGEYRDTLMFYVAGNLNLLTLL